MQRMMTHRQHLASRISQLSSMGCSFQHGRSLPSLQPRSRALNTRHRCAALPVLALVNIDFNPSLLLGMGLVGGGLTITSLRSVKPVVSRDLDIVIACVAWMSGGILIFQVQHLAAPCRSSSCMLSSDNSTCWPVVHRNNLSIVQHQSCLCYQDLRLVPTALYHALNKHWLVSPAPLQRMQDCRSSSSSSCAGSLTV